MKNIYPLTQTGETRVQICEVPEHENVDGEHTHIPCLRVAVYLAVDSVTDEKWPLCQRHGDMAKERGWVV